MRPNVALGGRPPAVVFWLREAENQPEQLGQRIALNAPDTVQ